MGIVETLKKEFDFEEEWVSYELHPETPREGVAITDKFPDLNLKQFRAGLNSKSAQYGVSFGEFDRISNSFLSLQVGELAKELGLYKAYHENIFRAYFGDGLDIGDLNVVIDVARKSGIDEHPVTDALNSGRFVEKLEQARREGSELGITSVPTFIIDEKTKLIGAQPLARFKKALSQK